jgi:hypothetical protein
MIWWLELVNGYSSNKSAAGKAEIAPLFAISTPLPRPA